MRGLSCYIISQVEDVVGYGKDIYSEKNAVRLCEVTDYLLEFWYVISII